MPRKAKQPTATAPNAPVDTSLDIVPQMSGDAPIAVESKVEPSTIGRDVDQFLAHVALRDPVTLEDMRQLQAYMAKHFQRSAEVFRHKNEGPITIRVGPITREVFAV